VPTTILRQPPRIKVLEASSAIADGRIEELSQWIARVRSSDGTRTYIVIIEPETMRVYSSDNGTLLRGYVGYPIISLMMLRGMLPFNKRIADALRGIPWKRLNETYRRYAVVEKIVKSIARNRGVAEKEIDDYINQVMSRLSSYRLVLDPELPKKMGIEEK